MSGSHNDLRYNTILIAIANIGSKAISFILAPMYSYFLSTGEYGTMDLFTTTASLLGPLFCLDIYEATFRYAKDGTYEKKDVISSSLAVCFTESFLLVSVIILACFFCKLPVTTVACLISVFIDTILNTLTQYARGCDRIKVFAFSGVVNSVVLLASNVVLLAFLHFGLKGWIISYILAKVIVIVYLCIRIDLLQVISIKYINKTFLREALKYSLPLMPNAMIWWVMNASDRYILAFSFNTTVVGIYAVASKLPSMLSVLENVFYQAWQTSSINALEENNRDKFYSDIFKKYFSVLTLGVLGLLLILKPMILRLFAHGYKEAWLSTSILVIAIMFHALSGYLGTFYVTFKNTKGALVTSTIGAVINIVLNCFFIPYGGIIAAATTTLIGYIVVLLYRWWEVKKFVKLTITPLFVVVWLGVIGVQFALYYIDGIWSYIVRFIILLVAMWVNREVIVKILKK